MPRLAFHTYIPNVPRIEHSFGTLSNHMSVPI